MINKFMLDKFYKKLTITFLETVHIYFTIFFSIVQRLSFFSIKNNFSKVIRNNMESQKTIDNNPIILSDDDVNNDNVVVNDNIDL